jgi:hypothetical protein
MTPLPAGRCRRCRPRAHRAPTAAAAALQPLPDALRGEKWAFVQLPLGILQQMLARVEKVRGS